MSVNANKGAPLGRECTKLAAKSPLRVKTSTAVFFMQSKQGSGSQHFCFGPKQADTFQKVREEVLALS